MSEQPQERKPRSKPGVASCSLFGIGLLLLIISLIGFGVLFARNAPVAVGFDAVLYVGAWGITLLLPPLHLIGAVVGLVGLLQKGYSKTLPAAGLILNLLVIPIAIACIIRFGIK